MASSSNSSIPKSYQYDVFLSFRGEDTRKTFVDHLYEALHQHGIRTFKDDERLLKGKQIDEDLLKSIDDSKFCIVVFSKNYASSSWCLDELVKIMATHKNTTFPVFYDVDPSEIRHQRGEVQRAFARHAEKKVAGKWREALKEAANMSGWDLRKTADGHEAKVIKIIVEWISLNLRPINEDIDENLVGMGHRMQDLDSCLEIGSDDVRMIGIKGMGGAGKTTLARAIFDKLSIRFEAKSFLENVRSSDVRSLQEKVLSVVLSERRISLESVHDGKRMMKERLCSKKILLVLDDVDHKKQLEALVGATDWFKPGSRIIITTRDQQVLIAHKVKLIRDVTLLSNEEAIHLFSKHAFGTEMPKSEYETQSIEAVRYAAGLPLTIKVLGSLLCGKNMPEWTDALKRLRRIPLKETLEQLELSFVSLEDDHKEMFLDVTCFMRGWTKDYAIKILERRGFHARYGLSVLEQRSLISMIGGGFYCKIEMHDHIEELGKHIVRRLHPFHPHKHSRLWIQEEIEDVLANGLGTEATKCVHFKNTPEIVLEGLGKMKELRYLHEISDGYIKFDDDENQEVSECFPNSLCALNWFGYPYWCLPKTFRASNHVILSMPCSRIKQLWPHGNKKVLKKLNCLELRSSNIRTLDLGLTPNLERLDLEQCKDLEELYVRVGCHQRLLYLNLRGCEGLKSLSFIKQLESLEYLDLSCLKLREFPDIIPTHSHSRLLHLHLERNEIEELSSSIGKLHKLVHLTLNGCSELKSLPRSLFSLQHLQTLDLKQCGIKVLPDELSDLIHSKKLYVTGTRKPMSIRLPLDLHIEKASTKLP